MAGPDLEVYKGDSPNIVLTVKNSSTGVAIDITGYTFYMMVKESPDDADGDAKINKIVTSHSDPTNGVTTISLSTEDTAQTVSSSTQKYVYDIRMKDTSNNITTLMKGNFKVLKPIRDTIA